MQGAPMAPLLSNIYLDAMDKELERRGHCFCRYADDCNIDVMRFQLLPQMNAAGFNRRMRKTARLVVWEGAAAQSPALHPI